MPCPSAGGASVGGVVHSRLYLAAAPGHRDGRPDPRSFAKESPGLGLGVEDNDVLPRGSPQDGVAAVHDGRRSVWRSFRPGLVVASLLKTSAVSGKKAESEYDAR